MKPTNAKAKEPVKPLAKRQPRAMERWQEAARKTEEDNFERTAKVLATRILQEVEGKNPFSGGSGGNVGRRGNRRKEDVYSSLGAPHEKAAIKLTLAKNPATSEAASSGADAARNAALARAIAAFPLLREAPKARPEPLKVGASLGAELADDIAARVQPLLGQLWRLAEAGDQHAAYLLLSLATDATRHLRDIAETNPSALVPLARKCLVWPDMIGKHAGARRWHEWLFTTLQLGEDAHGKGQWNESRPATQAAIFMYEWLREHQDLLRLPTLTDDTRRIWFKVGWAALLERTHGKPEEDEFLGPIGEYRARHTERTKGQKSIVSAASRMKAIRDGIKTRLKSAFAEVTKLPA